MTAGTPNQAAPAGPDTGVPGRAPWWVLALGVVVLAVTVFYLTDSVLPPMLDTDVTIPADGQGGPSGPAEGQGRPSGSDHTPPAAGFDHGPGGGP